MVGDIVSPQHVGRFHCGNRSSGYNSRGMWLLAHIWMDREAETLDAGNVYLVFFFFSPRDSGTYIQSGSFLFHSLTNALTVIPRAKPP